MTRFRLSAVLLATIVTAGCGGSKTSPPPTPTPTPTTVTLTGTTRQTALGSCSGDAHDFTAADGTVSIQLIETSDAAGALSVQVCAGGIDNRDCTINQQKVTVGQTLTGPRKGIASQNLKFLPHNCVFGGAFDPAVGVTYRVLLTHMR